MATAAVLTVTNEHHRLIATTLDADHLKYGWGFGIHVLVCFLLMAGSALEVSRRTHDPVPWMRALVMAVLVLLVASAIVQVLQVRLTQTFAAIALIMFTAAIHRGGLGHRDPDLSAGFDPTDPVTGLLSRRAIESVLTRMSDRPGGENHVLVVDVDQFKSVNDTFGHLSGDHVLTEIARRLVDAAPHLELGRFGGDEFVGVLRRSSTAEAHAAAERGVRSVSSQPVALPDGRSVAVSVSIGLASCTDGDWRAWVAQADAEMYRRKGEGRSRLT